MIRPVLLLLVLVVACFVLDISDSSAQSGGDRAVSSPSQQVFNIGNREEPTETQLRVIAKSFWVEMRGLRDPVGIEKLGHSYIDPRYLEKHGLKRDQFRMRTIPLVPNPKDDLEVADDRRTIVWNVGTGEGNREIVLFRATVHEGNLYFVPAKAPDPETGVVTPWILRMKLD